MVKKLSEIKEIIAEYKDILKQHHIHITKTILYGSYAKGTPGPYSDIDLVVVSPDFKRMHPLRRQEFLAQMTMDIDAPIEVLGYTPQELRSSPHTVFGQILRQSGKLF